METTKIVFEDVCFFGWRGHLAATDRCVYSENRERNSASRVSRGHLGGCNCLDEWKHTRQVQNRPVSVL
jgi:hypothetical protein